MMIPIAEAVLSSLETSSLHEASAVKAHKGHGANHHLPPIHARHHAHLRHPPLRGGHHAHEAVPAGTLPGETGDGQEGLHTVGTTLGKALMLGVAWSANVGGMATLTGTGPNIVLAGGVNTLFPRSPGLSFAGWMAFATPLAFACLLLVWCALVARFLPSGRATYNASATYSLILSQHRRLGPVSYREACVLLDFVLLAVLWVTRSPGFMPGWGGLFDDYATDATSAAMMATLLFAIPAKPPRILLCAAAAYARVRRRTAAAGPRRDGRAVGVHMRATARGWHAQSHSAQAATGTLSAFELGPVAEAGLDREAGLTPSQLESVRLATSDSAALAERTHSSALRRPAGVGREDYDLRADAVLVASSAEQPPVGEVDGEAPPRSMSEASSPGHGGAVAHRGALTVESDSIRGGALVTWPQVQARVPWGVLLLLGGGFALADACRVSGLSTLIGEQLSALGVLPPTAVLFVLILLAAAISTFASNVATTSILLPVVAALANSMGVHPYFFMVPVTLTTSLAFVLPVSTPPNALAFASGRLSVGDMAPLGLALCFGCTLLVLGFTLTMGQVVFDTGTLPEWATLVALNTTAKP